VGVLARVVAGDWHDSRHTRWKKLSASPQKASVLKALWLALSGAKRLPDWAAVSSAIFRWMLGRDHSWTRLTPAPLHRAHLVPVWQHAQLYAARSEAFRPPRLPFTSCEHMSSCTMWSVAAETFMVYDNCVCC